MSLISLEWVRWLNGFIILFNFAPRYERPYYVMDDLGSQYFEDLEDYGKSDVKKPKHAKKCDLCGLNHRTGRKCKKKVCIQKIPPIVQSDRS
jgi:hypothetical protein